MNDFLINLRETITTHHIDDATAEAIVSTMSKMYGGCPIYIRKNDGQNSERNAEIYRQFNGKNSTDLCRKFGLSYQQIYKIIAKERKKNEPKRIFNLKN